MQIRRERFFMGIETELIHPIKSATLLETRIPSAAEMKSGAVVKKYM